MIIIGMNRNTYETSFLILLEQLYDVQGELDL